MNERHKKILKILAEQNKVSVLELVETMNVSGVTIRQDLSELEEQGLLKRVHGGAILNNPDKISNRVVFNFDDKLKIARKAAEYVNDGETVFIESGSTNMLLAKELAQKQNITILTTNTYIAHELRDYPNVNVIIMGGIYQHQSESIVGKLTKLCIENVNFNKAFIGIDGFSVDAGFTGKDMLRVETASYIAEKAQLVYVLIHPDKFGKVALAKIFNTDKADCIVTTKIPENEAKYLKSLKVKIALC